MKTRKRKPFSIYPKAADMAEATRIAEEEDLHVYQVFMRAFRSYSKRRHRRAARRPALSLR
jgi:hypothetical protein